MERRFVYWIFNLPPKKGYKVQAAKLAGYGATKNFKSRPGAATTPHNMNSIAQDLLNKQRVIDLVVEVTKKQIRSIGPEALAAAREIIADPEHRDRSKMVEAIFERLDPTRQKLDISVKHEVVDRDAEAVAYLRKLRALNVSRDKLEAELGYSDLPRFERLLQLEDMKKSAAIDADYTVIEEKTDEHA